ncbi:hypothetical protein [Streptomyces sp. McG3]|uniref:hypothetical protein n=1 Tax=Streptomyces sp. McG3 TaxID=2725483 RepID=UPI001BEC6068|nr:hypothetical protein [Streptomyces sp. McG3]MBT2899050.1 hypothetical protein [Streptomyces sp. McG3]
MIDEPMAARQTTYPICRVRSLTGQYLALALVPAAQKGRSRRGRPSRIIGIVHRGELPENACQRSDMAVDLMRQGFRNRRVVEEVGGLQEVATVSSTHAARSYRQSAANGYRPAAQGDCRGVEFRAGGRTEPEGEYAPHLVLRVRLLACRYRLGAACACLHHVGH